MTVGVVALGPVMSSTVFAASVAASEQQATTSLVKQLSGIQSISSNFEQTTKVTNASKAPKKQGLSAQHMNQTFKGVMKVERPGKFYWETTSPAKQTIVTSGKTVWIYDPDLQQAVRQTLDEQVANTPALLLSSKTYYTLYPKSDDGAFQSLTISFGAKSAPTLMILEDSLGQTTYVRFNNTKVNASIPASTFNFTPPKGTDIIDQ